MCICNWAFPLPSRHGWELRFKVFLGSPWPRRVPSVSRGGRWEEAQDFIFSSQLRHCSQGGHSVVKHFWSTERSMLPLVHVSSGILPWTGLIHLPSPALSVQGEAGGTCPAPSLAEQPACPRPSALFLALGP